MTSSPPTTGTAASTAVPRITIVGPFHPHRGGIVHYSTCLARALKEQGCELQLIGYRRLYPRLLFPGRTEFDCDRGPEDIQAERLMTAVNPLRWWRALRKIQSFDPDLVLFPWWHSFLFPATTAMTIWLRYIQKRRVALLCHNLRSHDRALADRIAWRLLGRLPHAHIVHSSRDPERLREINPDARVVCVPHPRYDMFDNPGVTREKAREQLGLPEDAEVCLFFGLVRAYKGLDTALQAMAILKHRPRIHLVVAGEFYEDPYQYDQIIRRLDIDERVDMDNRYIPDAEVPVYFRAADLLVAPYQAASHSGVVQIARAMRLPVVAGDVGGLRDLVEDEKTGFLVPPSNPDALAGAIDRFFEEKLAESFRRRLEEEEERDAFSWKRLADAVRELACDSS